MLKSFLNKGLKIVVILLLIYTVSYNINSSNHVKLLEAYNLNENISVDALAKKEQEEKPKPKPKPAPTPTAANSNNLGGYLTGYGADCPLCGGTLACLSSYNVYKNNVVTYPDATYGNVRIVASSRNLPCGSIVRINSSRVPGGLAIVLDRGVLGNNLDLLCPSEAYASQYVGRSYVNYEVLRRGW